MILAFDVRSVFSGMGGIGRYAALLAKQLPVVDPELHMHLLGTERCPENIASASGRVRRHAHSCGMIDERWEQLELPGFLARLDADIYHGTCFSLPLARGARRLVVTVHDVVFRRHPDLVDPGLLAFLNRWTAIAVELADAVITVSSFSRREIAAVYGVDEARIRVVPNAVDPRFAASVPTDHARLRELGLPADYTLYLGALEAKKNIPRLLRAWRQVASGSTGTQRRLVLVGGQGGQQFDIVAAIAEAGVGDRVLVLGYLPDADVLAVMRGASCFVYPSLYEGFGLPVLEAMACGVPVVTSREGALAEIAGDAAELIDPQSDDDLARGILAVLTNRAHSDALRRRGRVRSAAFTPERCARETLAVYREVLAP